MKKVVKALSWLVVGLAALIVAVTALSVTNVLQFDLPFSSSTDTSDRQVVNFITPEEEVSLLGLGIQGVARSDSRGEVLGVPVPAGDRTTLIQYEFTAKVGINGADVTINEVEGGEYVVAIPQFVFIGYNEPRFEDPIESNGAISWLTPEVDETEMINMILSDANQQQYIDQNVDALRTQAEAFYRGIITAVVPDARVTFEFAQ